MPKERRDDEWLREWNEVQDHRYDPGYWLGGRIHPFWRRFGGTGKSASFGFELIVVGLCSAVAALWQPPLQLRTFFGFLSVMLVLLGISNVRAAGRASEPGHGDEPEGEAHRGTITDHDPRRHPDQDPRE